MRYQWELFTKADGSVGVQYADGRLITVSSDATQGYDFAISYLRKMAAHYTNHLRAADLLLRQQMGDKVVSALRATNTQVYNAHLAVQSMHCLFGAMDAVPDCDSQGELNTEFVSCPFRATCRYNGYHHTDKDIVCCNPIYELNLTKRQRQVADLLVNTSYTTEDIGLAIGVSAKEVRNKSSEIYATMGVANRQELTLLLRNKRLL